MRSELLQNALTEIDPALIARAAQIPPKNKKRRVIGWVSSLAAVLAIVITLSAILVVPTGYGYAVYAADYPDMASYPGSEWLPGFESRYDAWREDQKTQRSYFDKADLPQNFFTVTASAFLENADGENLVYSPLNVYLALAMLAETADGTTREELLTLLGHETITSLREAANALWLSNYVDDGAVTSILASSLWLDESLDYQKDTLKILADSYYASSFSGEMGTNAYTKAFRNWLKQETGGQLDGYIDELSLTPETVMALATTVFFQAKWEDEFRTQNTKPRIFHTPTGDETRDFMHETVVYGNYYWGTRFSATKKDLEESGTVWFVLPDEGVTLSELLKDEETLAFLYANGDWENQKSLRVNFALPKFEISSRTDLSKGLKSLGVISCFDRENADFSSLLSDGTTAWLDKIEHAATVAIDEEGVTAAAYTAMMMAGAAEPPEDEIDFTLDRPFLFVITAEDGSPLFLGTVNQP